MTRLRELLVASFKRAWGESLAALAGAAPAASRPGAGSRPRSFRGARAARDAITGELVCWLWTRNQFAELDAAARAELRASVERALHTIEQTRAIEPALAQHRAELAAFVRARFGDRPREVVCAEYAPDLQLAVLGLSDAQLAEPVLDVGCGAHASLVHALHARGIQAHGLDRVVEGELASEGDWLTYPYGRARYGTVLSHLGFTLHFLHHHLAGGDSAYDYARAYMAILGSLAARGRFVYTPGLPFMESLLDTSMYRVHRVPFAAALRVASLRQVEASTGLSLSHATHVERRS